MDTAEGLSEQPQLPRQLQPPESTRRGRSAPGALLATWGSRGTCRGRGEPALCLGPRVVRRGAPGQGPGSSCPQRQSVSEHRLASPPCRPAECAPSTLPELTADPPWTPCLCTIPPRGRALPQPRTNPAPPPQRRLLITAPVLARRSGATSSWQATVCWVLCCPWPACGVISHLGHHGSPGDSW